MNDHLFMEKRGEMITVNRELGNFGRGSGIFCWRGNRTVSESIAQHRDWSSREKGQRWGKEVTAANSPSSYFTFSSSGSFRRCSRNPSQLYSENPLVLLVIFSSLRSSSLSQHHEGRGRLLQHPKRGVGGIISSYQSSSSIKIWSIGPSSSSVTSCVFLDGIVDLVFIHLNFKHRLDEKPGGDLCTLLQLFSY